MAESINYGRKIISNNNASIRDIQVHELNPNMIFGGHRDAILQLKSNEMRRAREANEKPDLLSIEESQKEAEKAIAQIHESLLQYQKVEKSKYDLEDLSGKLKTLSDSRVDRLLKRLSHKTFKQRLSLVEKIESNTKKARGYEITQGTVQGRKNGKPIYTSFELYSSTIPINTDELQYLCEGIEEQTDIKCRKEFYEQNQEKQEMNKITRMLGNQDEMKKVEEYARKHNLGDNYKEAARMMLKEQERNEAMAEYSDIVAIQKFLSTEMPSCVKRVFKDEAAIEQTTATRIARTGQLSEYMEQAENITDLEMNLADMKKAIRTVQTSTIEGLDAKKKSKIEKRINKYIAKTEKKLEKLKNKAIEFKSKTGLDRYFENVKKYMNPEYVQAVAILNTPRFDSHMAYEEFLRTHPEEDGKSYSVGDLSPEEIARCENIITNIWREEIQACNSGKLEIEKNNSFKEDLRKQARQGAPSMRKENVSKEQGEKSTDDEELDL